jgi:argininosuccinate synthase
MYRVQVMEITFKNGDKKTISGVFKSKERMIYEVDEKGETKAVYNFDVIEKVEFVQNGAMSLVLVGD